MSKHRYFVGLISGTSADGIDAALIASGADGFAVRAANTSSYDDALARDLATALADPDRLTARDVGALDARVGEAFAAAAIRLLESAGINATDVTAIGSHGQTLYHAADAEPPFSLQVGDGARIAQRTGIDTINDFRRADIAAGGEGAPLAPLLHDHLLRDDAETRCVINLGGIANVTVLVPGQPVTGFDTGPSNTLMDLWARWCGIGAYDRDGVVAARGDIDEALLARLLDEPYFGLPAPKSTGRELFNAPWLQAHLGHSPLQARALPAAAQADVMATLCELSVGTIASALAGVKPERVILCGGGVRNSELKRRLAQRLSPAAVVDSASLGLDPDFVEAALFAWLAEQYVDGKPIMTAPITGSAGAVHAGTRHRPRPLETAR